ncbi:MAG: FAD-dependent oxidoreductase [Rhodothermales bacterium]|nr:FAD-dependent oxidoreductase [Rhodothermales bacterium]MBO6779240.1 FAD-dependent oxidoreductase [Rhodothermales bacterium]
MDRAPVIVVGAGLAGLTCARLLQDAGIAAVVYEASDAVGGRVRTDEMDGFRLDRGFQVLLTAYPETQALLDYEALELRTFFDGALVRTEAGFERIADPFRQPGAALATVLAGVGSLADKMKVALLRQGVRSGELESVFEREEMTTANALSERWGFSPRMIDTFFRPFLGGILLDGDLQASSRMFEFVFRMFSEGQAAVPARGMQAIPEQLADGLTVHLNTPVGSLQSGEVVLQDGTKVPVSAVVVATAAPAAARLVPEVVHTSGRRVTNLYFSAPEAPVSDPVLVLNGTGSGQVNNLAVMTNAAPEYGPGERALVSVTVLGALSGSPQDVQDELSQWYPAAVAWQHLRTYDIEYALPEQAPPFLSPPHRAVKYADGLFVCGDHRDTASINGAMASGRRAAEAVREFLAAR